MLCAEAGGVGDPVPALRGPRAWGRVAAHEYPIMAAQEDCASPACHGNPVEGQGAPGEPSEERALGLSP